MSTRRRISVNPAPLNLGLREKIGSTQNEFHGGVEWISRTLVADLLMD